MDIPTHSELVERIDAFLVRHDMAPTRLGRIATGEPNLIPSIRDGRQPNLETLNRLGRVMAEHDAALTKAGPTAEWPVPSAGKDGEISGAEPESVPNQEATAA